MKMKIDLSIIIDDSKKLCNEAIFNGKISWRVIMVLFKIYQKLNFEFLGYLQNNAHILNKFTNNSMSSYNKY